MEFILFSRFLFTLVEFNFYLQLWVQLFSNKCKLLNVFLSTYIKTYVGVCLWFKEISLEPARKSESGASHEHWKSYSGFWQLNRLIVCEYCSNWYQYIHGMSVCVCVRLSRCEMLNLLSTLLGIHLLPLLVGTQLPCGRCSGSASASARAQLPPVALL